jgi:hypothetical protein
MNQKTLDLWKTLQVLFDNYFKVKRFFQSKTLIFHCKNFHKIALVKVFAENKTKKIMM